MNWTNSYCGVSHAELDKNLHIQLTVTTNGAAFVKADFFDFRSNKPFTPIYTRQFEAGQIEQTKTWLEGLLPK